MNGTTSLTSTAQRRVRYQRAYRERQRLNMVHVPANVPRVLIEQLTEMGLLAEAKAGDRKAIGEALVLASV